MRFRERAGTRLFAQSIYCIVYYKLGGIYEVNVRAWPIGERKKRFEQAIITANHEYKRQFPNN